MAQQFALEHDTPAYNPRYADAFVVFAVTVLSLAIGVWCLLRLDLALWAGAVAALAVYTALLSVHLLVRRSLVAVEGATVEGEHSDLWARGPYAPAEADAEAPHPADEEIARWAETARAGERSPAGELPQPRPADPFDYRPKAEPSLPHVPGAAGLASLGDAGRHADGARPSGVAQPEMSVELIQDLIKKLADELNTTTAAEKSLPATRPRP
jgi:hypothetical protein